MKWVVIAVVVLGALIALVALIGSRLPQSHHASVEQIVTAPPEAVWMTITDVEAFPSWRADVKRVQRLPDREGRPAWIEEGRSGKITLAVERLEPPRLIPSCRLAGRGPMKSHLSPAAAGCASPRTEKSTIRSSGSWRVSSSGTKARFVRIRPRFRSGSRVRRRGVDQARDMRRRARSASVARPRAARLFSNSTI